MYCCYVVLKIVMFFIISKNLLFMPGVNKLKISKNSFSLKSSRCTLKKLQKQLVFDSVLLAFSILINLFVDLF